jgi:hypothetical protein
MPARQQAPDVNNLLTFYSHPVLWLVEENRQRQGQIDVVFIPLLMVMGFGIEGVCR